jgi:hypothetical protein
VANPLGLRLGECLPRSVFPAPCDGRLRELSRTLLFVSFLFPLMCTACGAVGSGPTQAPAASIAVQANPPQAFLGGTAQFSAIVQNASSSAVNWSIAKTTGTNLNMGTIDSKGLYTAPSSPPAPAAVTVVAVLQNDSSVSGSASVAIQSSLTLSPARASIVTPQTLPLEVVNAGIAANDVSWSASGGTISPGGLYTPPAVAGTYTIAAVLNSNSNVTGQATVYVTDFPGTLTWRNDNARSGVNSQELALAPATVSSSTFGKLFSCPAPADGPLDGYVYAQPLYVPNLPIPGKGTHNVIFVATEKDSVLAFDADSNPCEQLWMASLIPLGSEAIGTPNPQITSTDIVPFVGITGTPVIDLRASILYVVAESQTITGAANICSSASSYCHFLYAVDLGTGQPLFHLGGTGIATLAGHSSVFFPTIENQRAALLLNNGTVYIAFGSYGGQGEYHGWLFGYDASSLQQTGVFNITPDAMQGGIWQSGGGPSADSNGNIFEATGDGPFDVNRGGLSYSNSFLRLGTAGVLTVFDYFTPCDQATLQSAGLDVGASAPVLLPDSAGSASQPHLLIGGSKGGSLYVVNRDAMGEYSFPCPDLPARVQTIPVGGAILSTPLFWNNAVYVAPGNGKLMSFPMSAGILASSPSASQSPEKTLGPHGATPVISWNGTDNNTAILWLIDTSTAQTWPTASGPAILRAYDPNNLSNEIYSSPTDPSSPNTAGAAVKFTVPTVANGKVYVGTQKQLDVYGLLQ